MGSFVELTAVDGAKTPAYVAMPEGKPRGAVVVLQEIFGVNPIVMPLRATWPWPPPCLRASKPM